MPFIHVRSLPFAESFDGDTVVENLTRDFSRESGIGLEHVTATWEFLPAGHQAVGGKSAKYQPNDSHPVLVELLVPDFNSAEKIGKMLLAVAASISSHTTIKIDNIFINCRRAHSGMVFDAGEINFW